MMMTDNRLNIVLVEPEIPPNTGNIARLCAAVQADLHLVKPLGFSIDDKHLKRAGLDYWHLLKVHVYENFNEFETQNAEGQFFWPRPKRLSSIQMWSFQTAAICFSDGKRRGWRRKSYSAILTGRSACR